MNGVDRFLWCISSVLHETFIIVELQRVHNKTNRIERDKNECGVCT